MPPLNVRVIETRIVPEFDGFRVIDLLTKRFTYRDEAAWRERLAAGEFLLDGKSAAAEELLRTGMVLRYVPRDVVEPEVDLSYRVLHEDPDLLIVDKSGDIPVHPSGVFYAHTLWYLLTEHFGKIHPVNRLDRETSGLLAVARNPRCAARLSGTEMRKSYWVLVFGDFPETLDAKGVLVSDPSSRVRRKRKFLLHGSGGEFCRTLLEPVRHLPGKTLIRARLFTGRMHQIRATLCSLGYPVVGDKLYGPDETMFIKRAEIGHLDPEDYHLLGMRRQALHAAELEFTHPATGEKMLFESPLPEDFRTALDL